MVKGYREQYYKKIELTKYREKQYDFYVKIEAFCNEMGRIQ